MYNERIEALISAALADGVLTEKEKQILLKNAKSEGIDLDEFEMVLNARLVELEKAKEEATKSAPKSNKLGDVRKCPACGALVNSFHRKCQECGYVFENIQTNSSVNQLLESLRKAKNEKERQAIISSFPIPSSKGDLMEFITVLHPKVFSAIGVSPFQSDAENEDSVYVCKYEECLEKIKMYFPDDEDLFRFVNEYKKGQKNAIKFIAKLVIGIILVNLVLLAILNILK